MTSVDQTTSAPPSGADLTAAPFGSVFVPSMMVTRFDGSAWAEPTSAPLRPFDLHPGSHALHYGSTCFEGLKAHRQPDGTAKPFRADAHAARFALSAARLCLPVPPPELTEELIAREVAEAEAAGMVPDPPGALYLRPTLLGTDETIGAAAHASETAICFVLACPVGDYLPPRPLVISVETQIPRTTPQFGSVKAGANYAMALTPINAARERDGADQVLFAPGGVVQETGASNVVLIDGEHLVTPPLSDAFLHGVTRDSLLRVARARGWNVEERDLTVDEVVKWIARPTAELALTGTAAVVGPVGTLVVDGQRLPVGTEGQAPGTATLRQALLDIQTGHAEFDW